MSNYANIIKGNLQRLYSHLPADLADRLPATRVGDDFLFQAFGDSCRIAPDTITIGDKTETGPAGIVISLYALQATGIACRLAPYKAFREMSDSMPYVGAFASNTERVLMEHIDIIEREAGRIVAQFNGSQEAQPDTGDFSFILYPLPKIALNYIFYRADDEFPAAVTCLFSSNAPEFLKTDALADTGEYTSKKILDIL
ncbi:MAG: DUF3786 domain-containing protein [Deltaproteobacteria bacterium]|jgi:hypothetical protein|nr:DUF3786 domain-containing protein [Deltaproteobacteria bacterium]